MLTVGLLYLPLQAQQAAPTRGDVPNALSRELSSQPAKEVVARMNAGSGRRWHEAIRGIQTGSPAWLNVAGKLLDGTDAGRTEEIDFALSVALTRNAAGVLSLLGPKTATDKICSVPYIEPSHATIRTYTLKATSALKAVRAPELQEQKQACLKSLNAK